MFSFNFYQKNKINVAIHIQCTVYIMLYNDVWSTELVLKKRKKETPKLQTLKSTKKEDGEALWKKNEKNQNQLPPTVRACLLIS